MFGPAPDHRQHIGRAGPRPHPRIRLDRLAQGEGGPRQRLDLVHLVRRGGTVPEREFSPRCNAHAFQHGRCAIGIIGIIKRMVQNGIAHGAVMAVIAALDPQRHMIAQRPRDFGTPWPQSQDNLASGHSTLHRINPPAIPGWVHGPRIAFDKHAAALLEKAQIGARQFLRIGHIGRIGVMNSADNRGGDMRLFQRKAFGIDHLGLHPIGFDRFQILQIFFHLFRIAGKFQPAGLPDQMLGTCRLDQQHMFGHAIFNQGQSGLGGFQMPLRRGGAPIAIEKRRG